MYKPRIWRHQDGALPNLAAFCYVLLSHVIAVLLMSTANLLAWGFGVVILANGLVVAAYLIHDLAHFSIFATRKLTLGAGEILSWICGAAYAPMSRIQRMHMRHHGDIADVALFDPRLFLKRAPHWVRTAVYLLEWAYIPAVELIMHYQVLLRPFFNGEYRGERSRVLVVGTTRILFFLFLFALSPWVLVGYAFAYLLFLIALFLADAYAHTYEYYLIEKVEDAVPRDGRDESYDNEHTFSNLISERWPWLNLLNLNFGYHLVHHQNPQAPWYRLPSMHRQNCAQDSPQILPYRELWRSFRRNRLKRIEADDAGDIGVGAGRADGFLGVHGVSFLSIV